MRVAVERLSSASALLMDAFRIKSAYKDRSPRAQGTVPGKAQEEGRFGSNEQHFEKV